MVQLDRHGAKKQPVPLSTGRGYRVALRAQPENGT